MYLDVKHNERRRETLKALKKVRKAQRGWNNVSGNDVGIQDN